VEVTITTQPEGGVISVMPGYTFVTGPSIRDNIQRITTLRGAVELSHPEEASGLISTTIEQLPPGSSGIVRFRLGFAGCGESELDQGYIVLASAVASVGGIPLNDVPATDQDTLNCPAPVITPATDCIECV